MSARLEISGPKDAATSKGPRIAVVANADAEYGSEYLCGKRKPPLAVSFRALDGRDWRYSGKKGRVLETLATSHNGVTQHDTLPWHTRLGGTIHAMRQDGLSISTELEGPYRHARYRLCTPGALALEGGAA